MANYPIPDNEILRLESLHKYNVLDTMPEPAFDDIVKLAAQICDVPISLVSLIDEDRQWFKAKVGLAAEQTPRDVAFCAHAIMKSGFFVIQDALLDERFATNPLVTSDPNIRFYAGCVLGTPEGYNIGTLCIIDRKPRELNTSQYEALQALSRQVIAQLELRKYSNTLKEALENLKKSEAKNRAFLSALPDSMYLISSDGHVLALKARKENELAVFGSEIVSKTLEQILPKELAIKTKQLVEQAIENEEVQVYEYEYNVLNKIRHYESRVVKSGEDEALAIIRDITDRKEAENLRAEFAAETIKQKERLEEANLKLKELDRVKAEFTAMLVHDLKTPLTVVSGTLQILEMGDVFSKEEVADMITTANTSLVKMLDLINDMLEVFRSEDQEIKLRVEEISPTSFLKEHVEETQMAAYSSQISVESNIDKDLPKLVVDRKQFGRALSNLLSNAIKFTPTGGKITIEAHLEKGKGVEAGLTWLLISITDTGQGIEAQELPYIFDPYRQAISKKAYLGVGLGLAIVKRIIAAHGGSISVQSQVGIGTCFTISLPITKL